MSDVQCMNCRFSIPVNEAEDPLLCDNPTLPSYGRNVKHPPAYRCGNGVLWTAPEVVKPDVPLEVPVAIKPLMKIPPGYKDINCGGFK